jgi:hypothetical protein
MGIKAVLYFSLWINGFLFLKTSAFGQELMQTSALVIARVHYNGGGDWYNDPSIIPNLCRFIKSNTLVHVEEHETQIKLGDDDLFSYPILFLTGHGRITFSSEEARKLRAYLLAGGFLYADDDYGMDAFFRKEMLKVFPERSWIELPFTHGIYHILFQFQYGLPKIHEHDNNSTSGLGLLDDQGRLMVFYSYESNISDGWADVDVHQDPPEKREAALRMGTNIILWALLN